MVMKTTKKGGLQAKEIKNRKKINLVVMKKKMRRINLVAAKKKMRRINLMTAKTKVIRTSLGTVKKRARKGKMKMELKSGMKLKKV